MSFKSKRIRSSIASQIGVTAPSVRAVGTVASAGSRSNPSGALTTPTKRRQVSDTLIQAGVQTVRELRELTHSNTVESALGLTPVYVKDEDGVLQKITAVWSTSDGIVLDIT